MYHIYVIFVNAFVHCQKAKQNQKIDTPLIYRITSGKVAEPTKRVPILWISPAIIWLHPPTIWIFWLIKHGQFYQKIKSFCSNFWAKMELSQVILSVELNCSLLTGLMEKSQILSQNTPSFRIFFKILGVTDCAQFLFFWRSEADTRCESVSATPYSTPNPGKIDYICYKIDTFPNLCVFVMPVWESLSFIFQFWKPLFQARN